MFELITSIFIKKLVKRLAKKVALSLATKTISDGIGKIVKKSPEEKVAKALEKALDKVSPDNEFWKNDVKRQIGEVIQILIRIMDNPQYLDKNPLPNYLDEKTIQSFKDCLKKDPEAWDYLQKVHYEDILQDIRVIVRDTKDIVQETNERTKRIEEKLDGSNNLPDCHFLTRTPSKADFTNVIGRKEDLERLWKVLREKHHIILTGFGGIGKTKLAQLLFHEYEKEFEEVAWIDYQGNLKKSFLTNITAPQLQSDNSNDDERWYFMESRLKNDGKKKLFIIDNVDNESDQHPKEDELLQELTGWNDTTVLLTSRMKGMEDFHSFDLGYLSKEDCITLFNRYYEGENAAPELVAKLVELAGLHTLTIELLAKGAWQEEDLGEYYEKVKSSFEKADEKVRTKHHHNEEDTIVHHLQYLFDMQKRDSKEIEVLQCLAILPVNCECTKKELEDWFGFKKSDWSALIQDGWLNFDINKKVYSLHPLVRTIIRFDFAEDAQNEKNIAPQGTADKILDFFWKDGKWYDIANGYVSLQRLIGIVEAAMGAVAYEESERFGSLYHKLGYIYDDLGAYDKALEYDEKALAIKEKILGTEHPDTATTYNNIGLVYNNKGDYDKALEYFEKALAIREKVLGTEHPNTATTYNNIGLVYNNKGDYDKALEYFEKALAIREKVLGTEHPDTAATYNNIGAVHYARGKQGDYDKALVCYEKALAIREKVLGTKHTDIAQSYNNMGAMHYARGKQGDYDKALEYYFKALPIVEKNLGPEHPNVALNYNNIGSVYWKRGRQGDYDKALEYYEKALEIDEKVLGKDHPNTAGGYNNIGSVYWKRGRQGDYDSALEYFFKALPIVEKNLGPEHPIAATTYNNIGLVYYQMKKHREALNYLVKALQIRKDILGDDHPNTKNTQRWIDATKAAMSKGK